MICPVELTHEVSDLSGGGRVYVVRSIAHFLADHLLIWRVDHISANAGRPVTPTKLLGQRHLGQFSEPLFADPGEHLIGRSVSDLAWNDVAVGMLIA